MKYEKNRPKLSSFFLKGSFVYIWYVYTFQDTCVHSILFRIKLNKEKTNTCMEEGLSSHYSEAVSVYIGALGRLTTACC